jgi:hypothetical protein
MLFHKLFFMLGARYLWTEAQRDFFVLRVHIKRVDKIDPRG